MQKLIFMFSETIIDSYCIKNMTVFIRAILILFLIATDFLAQSGYVRTYYPNRKIKSRISYVDDVLDGTSYWFYDNGNLKEEKTYSNGKLHGWIIKYYESGLVREEISVREGIRDGLTRLYYENGALKEVRSYERGKLIKRVELDYDDKFVPSMNAYKGTRQTELEKRWDMFICREDVCPKPPGGMDDILSNLVYPEHAKLYGLEGFVTVIATVDEEGNVIEARVTKGLGLGCDEAALDAVKATKFLPGGNDGQAVQCDVIFNVEFKLDDKTHLAYNGNLRNPELAQARLKEMLFPGANDQNSAEYNTGITVDSLTKSSQYNNFGKNFDCEIDFCPRPIGGLKAILDNLYLPRHVKRLGAEGQVTVLANVDEYGLVRDTKVLQGLSNGINDAVEVAILNTLFEPGKQNGADVRTDVKLIIPILQKKEE
jgi:protein TonB